MTLKSELGSQYVVFFILINVERMLGFGRKLPARVAGSMLRLGRKYVIACLENEVLRRLHHDFPTTLAEWDSSEDRQIEDGSELVTVFEVISIAHEFRLFTILPAVYAKYVELLPLVASFCHNNAVVSDYYFEQERLPRNPGIPEKARECCILGYVRILEYLKKTNTDALCPPLILPSQTCSRRGKCEANTIQKLPVWDTGESERFGIFGRWGMRGPHVTKGLCARCQVQVKKLTNNVRSEFWLSLPTFFGLPAWADLKDEL